MLAWISNHMSCKVWGEINYPFPNFAGTTVEVWERLSNFIPYFKIVKGATVDNNKLLCAPCNQITWRHYYDRHKLWCRLDIISMRTLLMYAPAKCLACTHPTHWTLGPIHCQFSHHYLNSIENLFGYNSICGHHITKNNFCTCKTSQLSCHVQNLVAITLFEIRKRNFIRIWVSMELLFVNWFPERYDLHFADVYSLSCWCSFL